MELGEHIALSLPKNEILRLPEEARELQLELCYIL